MSLGLLLKTLMIVNCEWQIHVLYMNETLNVCSSIGLDTTSSWSFHLHKTISYINLMSYRISSSAHEHFASDGTDA